MTKGFPGGSVVKNPPIMHETQVQSLGQEDPLEKEMAMHSSILAWEIPWKEEPGGLQSMGSHRVRHKWETEPAPRVYIYVNPNLRYSVSSGSSAVAFVSYSSLGKIINATSFEEMNEKVYLNSQVVSAAIGPKKNTSLSQPVTLSFQHMKVGQSCNMYLLGFHGC